ncbi:MAG TPA: sugar phosphate isomerase/epimerase [Clostridia bacterium]|nr:sugar phosphate isomerase/epimerase [Clostridia bacterium]
MNNSAALDRRSFLKSGLLGSAALAAATLPQKVIADLTKPERDPCLGLKLGVASYTLRKFSLEEAIAMTKEAGLRYISLKDMHLPFKTTPTQRQEARKKIEAAGLTLFGGGVIYMKNNPAEIQGYFEYAKDAGMPVIVCSPEIQALDEVEKMAKQYDLRVAIHNHGPGDKNYPSPLDVLRLIQNRDSRMGICIDVGHTVRLGEDPIEVIRKCASRLYDFHIKDVTKAAPEGRPTEVGRGVIDVVGVLRELVRIKFSDHFALEYEIKENAPMPGIIESVAFMRGVLAVI